MLFKRRNVLALTSNSRRNSQTARSRSAARRCDFKHCALIALTIAIAVPTGPGAIFAQESLIAFSAAMLQQEPPMGNSERLRLGLDQYRRGQYEEAVANLQLVDVNRLAPNDRRLLADTLARAESAANERRAARAEFERGQQALDAGNNIAAITHFKNAANNRFADEGTKAKAREQIAVAEAGMSRGGQSLREIYNQAVADYKAGDLAAARQRFQQLQAVGFRAPMFQRSPSDYLREIERRIGDEPPPLPDVTPRPDRQPEPIPDERPPEVFPPGEEIPPPTPEEPEMEPEVTPEPLPEPEPQEQPIDRPEMPEPEVTQPDAREPVAQPPFGEELPPYTPAPETVPPPGFDQPPTEETLPERVSQDEARRAYREGRRLMREGDLEGARRQFLIAQRGGYRTGLFETPVSRYLAQIDRQQQAQARAGAAAAQTTTLSREQARAQARELVTQADQARQANRVDEALALYSRAADLDPGNDRAVQGRDEMLRITGRLPTGQTALDAQERAIREARTFVDYSIRRNLDEAQQMSTAGRYTEALAAVQRAQVARDSNPGVFTEEELRQYDAMIANTRTAVAQAEEQSRLAEATAAQRAAIRQERERQEREAQERERTVRARVREAQELVRQGQYRAAINVIDQILALDPNNEYAQGARPLVEDRALFLEQRLYREQFDRELTRTLNMAEEQRVPYNDILRYPANWPELSEIRERSVGIERGEQGEDQEIIAQLERRLPEVRLEASAFADVVEFLRDVSGTNIFVNWRALEAVGIDRTSPVTARLRDVKFSKVLRTILDDVGGGTVRLAYTIDDGVITISTEDDLASNVVTRVYDIRDLILRVPDFDNAPDFQISGSSAGGGGGGGLFGGGLGDQEEQGAQTRDELVEAIISLIQDTVSSDSWKDNGGAVGSIRELQGQLIVTQTPENQRALVRLLEQLRETRAIQITVEARFLVVQRNFLEDVGVDFDFTFNNDDPTETFGNGRRFSPVTVSQNSTAFNADLGALDTTVPGNLGLEYVSRQLAPNLTTGFTFLDDFQVSLLLRATQASQYSSTLTAPRLTLFNGQRAFVVVATETAYVSDLTPIVGVNAVAFDPEPDVIQSGVLLDVVATVSSDRKYVTLTLRPTLSRLRDLVQFPVTALSGGGGQTGGPPISQTAFLQQPVRDITSVQTTVSVPDGGTLLIGGQTLNGEIEREAGVPILSKIPFLKRLFTNRSIAKDDQVLLILIRPTIIIQREREAEQFPLLGARTGG